MFLNALLCDPAFADTAVLINEFGEVAIDHDLVALVTVRSAGAVPPAMAAMMRGDTKVRGASRRMCRS